MFERFTASARNVVVRAVEEAFALDSAQLRAGHLLLALSAETGPAGQLLQQAGLSADVIRSALPKDSPRSEPLDRDALLGLGIDLDAVRRVVEENFGPGALDAVAPTGPRRRPGRRPGRRRGGAGRLPFEAGAKRSLELGLRQAVQLGSRSLGSEHLLLGVLQEPPAEVRTVVTGVGLDPDELRDDLLDRLRHAA